MVEKENNREEKREKHDAASSTLKLNMMHLHPLNQRPQRRNALPKRSRLPIRHVRLDALPPNHHQKHLPQLPLPQTPMLHLLRTPPRRHRKQPLRLAARRRGKRLPRRLPLSRVELR